MVNKAEDNGQPREIFLSTSFPLEKEEVFPQDLIIFMSL